MWKAERMRRIERKHDTDTDGTKGDGEGQNSREEHNRRAENRQEQTETDRDRQRQTENVREQILRNRSALLQTCVHREDTLPFPPLLPLFYLTSI